MAKDLTDILTRAAEVRDESIAEQNTAQKVGAVLTDLIDLLRTALTAADFSIQSTATELHILVTNYDDDGAPIQSRVVFPLASETKAGVLTASQLQSLKNFVVQEGTAEASKLPIKFTSPLSGAEQLFYLGGATADRAGVMSADMFTNLQTATARRIETIDISQLDSLVSVPQHAKGAADYWLTHNSLIVGRMFMFEDMMLHKSTQIVICNNYAEGFPTGGHFKEGLTIYYRFYGHGSTDVAQGKWTAWKKIFDSEVPSAIPLASTTTDGLMTKEMVVKQSEIETSLQVLDNVVDIGTVSSSAPAENRAVELSGDKQVVFMRYETADGQIGTIRQVYTNLGYSMQYLTLNGTEFVRIVYYDSGMKSVWRNINKASLVYKLLYDAGSRVLSFHDPIHDEGFGGITLPVATDSSTGLLSNTEHQKLSSFNIYESATPSVDSVPVVFTNPITGTTSTFNLKCATVARAGMMTANQVTALSNVSRIVHYLGDFNNHTAAATSAADVAVAGNVFISVIRYTIWEAESGMILQQVGTGQTLQYRYESGVRWTRVITFTNNQHTAVSSVQPWQREGVRNLAYSNATRVLALQDMHSNNVGSSVTLPIGTTDVCGLLKLGTTAGTAFDGAAGKALADRITALETSLSSLTSTTNHEEEN